MNLTAVYAGTFDPITLGHLDVIQRASCIFQRLVVAVAEGSQKEPLFTLEERLKILGEVVKDIPRVEIESFRGLLVDYVHQKGYRVVIRGLRAFSDFEYEFQMALTNRKMAADIETVFLMPKEEYSYISSSMVREIAEHGGPTELFVPPASQSALVAKLKRAR
jgi:pantetheine-phosphate adenylyltransferase